MPVIVARHSGRCRICGFRLEAGTRVRWSKGQGIACHGGHARPVDPTEWPDEAPITATRRPQPEARPLPAPLPRTRRPRNRDRRVRQAPGDPMYRPDEPSFTPTTR